MLILMVVIQSGERITNLDDLQDIDELHVVEVTLPADNKIAAAAYLRCSCCC